MPENLILHKALVSYPWWAQQKQNITKIEEHWGETGKMCVMKKEEKGDIEVVHRNTE